MMLKPCAVPALAVALSAGWILPASAQSLAPMQGEAVTFSDRAGFRLSVRNPYSRASRFEIIALDADGTPAPDVVLSRSSLPIAPGATAELFVLAPLGGATVRDIRICATSSPFYGAGSAIRGRVCGKYRAVFRQL